MPNAKSLSEAALQGDARALARLASLVENRGAGYRDVLRPLFAVAQRGVIVGITGPPGAGKSTLTSALVAEARAGGKRVAVLAVDPSSPYTGGAILGDRIRMAEHFGDPSVYIRSMASRGATGGLAPAAYDVSLLLSAAGFDLVFLETVGAGQDEVEVARFAGVTVVVLAPGMGDDVQAIKAGILEVAGVYALNKADTDGITRLEAEVRAALDIAGWHRPVVRVSAARREGVAELLRAIEAAPKAAASEALWRWRLGEMYREALLAELSPEEVAAAARAVAEGGSDPYTVIEEWLRRLSTAPSHLNSKEE